MDTTQRKKENARRWRERNPGYNRRWAAANPDRVARYRRKDAERRRALGMRPLRRAADGEVAALVDALKRGETYAAAGKKFQRDSGTVAQWTAPWRDEIRAARQGLSCLRHVRARCLCDECIQRRGRAQRERDNEARRLSPGEIVSRREAWEAERAADRAAKQAAREAKAAAREAARPERERRKRERKKADRKAYYARFPEKKKVLRQVNKARRRAAKKGATVELSPEEKKKVSALYTEARRLTKETGYQWSVHHVIPLSKGGPHHPDNLEVITATMNNAIGDKPMKGWDYLMS